jgi:cytochrome P450
MVEEALRLEAPVQGSVRVATRDAEIGGVDIPEGSRVLVLSGAANHDPDVFPDPERIDLERDNIRSHLTFGKGIHLCLGASLSRIEGRVMFETLFDHFNHFELTEEFTTQYAQNAVLRSLKSLPMRVSQSR